MDRLISVIGSFAFVLALYLGLTTGKGAKDGEPEWKGNLGLIIRLIVIPVVVMVFFLWLGGDI